MFLPTLLIILPALPTLFIVYAGVNTTDQLLGCTGVALAFLVGVSPMGTYFAWQAHPILGICYFVVTYVTSFIFTARLSELWAGWHKLLGFTLVLWIATVAWLLTFRILPRVEIPKVALGLLQPQPSLPVDPANIRDSIHRIQSSIAGTANDIQREQANIESATKQLLEDLDRRTATIRRLQLERDQLVKQIQQERALAALTSQQAEAIRLRLARGRYLDYGMGFLIGIASSMTATVISRMFRRSPY